MFEETPEAPVAELSVALHTADGNGIRVIAAGEVDMSTADRLDSALSSAIDFRPSIVVVDLAAVTFLGSTGVTTLVAGHRRAAGAGVPLRVVNCTGMVRRVLEVTGVWKALSRDP